MPNLLPKLIPIKDGAGLYLNIKHNGTKQWLFRFYWDGTQKRISFGVYPNVDLKQARSLRQHALDLITSGIDPRTGIKRLSGSQTNTIRYLFAFVNGCTYW